MRTGEYDGVSASGDATLRLIEGGDVDPVNIDLVPNYETIFADLKDQPYNTVDGVNYGIPHGRGANLLMWNTDAGQARSDVLVGGLRPGAGVEVQGQDHGLRQPDLHRRRGAVPEGAPARSRHRRTRTSSTRSSSTPRSTCSSSSNANVGEYWSDYTKQISAFASGDSVVGTTWQVINHPARRTTVTPMATEHPARRGCDRLVRHLDDQFGGQAPELHVHVDGPHHQPEGQRRRWPSGSARRPRTRSPATPRRADHERITATSTTQRIQEFLDQVYYWTTPVADCGDDRGDVCKDLQRLGLRAGPRSRADPSGSSLEHGPWKRLT